MTSPAATRLDDPQTSLSEYEGTILRNITTHGWHTTYVQAAPDAGPRPDPAFSYSTGFWHSLNHPEIIIFDFPAALAHDVLGTLYRAIAAGTPPQTGTPIGKVLKGETICLIPVAPTHARAHLLSAFWFHKGHDIPVLQLVWPDPAGHFPWHEGFDPALRSRQPDLSDGAWSGRAR